MLGRPETVVAEPIHQLGHGLRLAQRSGQMRIAVTPLVDGRTAIADIVEVGMAGKKAIKLRDHNARPGWARRGNITPLILDQTELVANWGSVWVPRATRPM